MPGWGDPGRWIDPMDPRGLEQPKPTTHIIDVEDWRKLSFKLGSFATGAYVSHCVACGKHFAGDKRALHCLPCAIAATEGYAGIRER